MATKRLYRSKENKVFGGILGGFGEYLEVDPVILRLFYIAITIFTGVAPGIIVYIIGLFLVPHRPVVVHTEADADRAH